MAMPPLSLSLASSSEKTGSFVADPLFWAVVGVVVAILALYVGYLALRRQFPKRELRYWVQAIPLLSSNPLTDHFDLQVLVDGQQLRDPHAITVMIESRSRADIPSSAFDAGEPIVITSSVPMYLSAGTKTGPKAIGLDLSLSGNSNDGSRVVKVPPQLIRPKAFGAFSAVSEGKPEIMIDSSLVDIGVKYGAPSFGRTWVVWAGPLAALVGAASGIFVGLLSSR